MTDKSYYRCRNGGLYTNYTKEEINNLIDLDDFSTWCFFLKDMDYPALLPVYETRNDFHEYIAAMKLAGYRSLGWGDSFPVYHTTTSKAASIELDKATNLEKIILTKRSDGEQDCVTEQIAYNGQEYLPIRISGVIGKSDTPGALNFKISDGCYYKVEVIDNNGID